jgi:crossover junction endodeoxyribonuclease RuvC
MRVLGIDPGTLKTGWGVVECDGSRLRHVASGTIRTGRGELAARLAAVYEGLSGVIARHAPGIVSLERNFLALNVQSAFRLGEARGVAMAAAAAAGLEVCEYTPATIKKAVVGHGRADKGAVQAAVTRLLSLATGPSEDEADALATAACHGFCRSFDAKVRAAVAGQARAANGGGRRAPRLPRGVARQPRRRS